MVEYGEDFDNPLTEYDLGNHKISFRYASRLIIYPTTSNLEDLIRETGRVFDELIE